ncbi:hypothetical protein Neosp_011737 [[Neocosmospora] mangrovei]
MAEETKSGKEYPAAPPPETNPLGDDEPASEATPGESSVGHSSEAKNQGGKADYDDEMLDPWIWETVPASHYKRPSETKLVKDFEEPPPESNPRRDDNLHSDAPPDEPPVGHFSEGMSQGGEAAKNDENLDESASELPPDETYPDDSVETENRYEGALETKVVKDWPEQPEDTIPPPDDYLGWEAPPDEPSSGHFSEGLNKEGEADDDDEASTSEAIPNDTDAGHSAETKNTGGDVPLHELLLILANGNEDLTSEAGLDDLSRILKGGAQVNAKDADGETALHLAAANGLFEAAKMLIEYKANVSEPDSEKRQPLHRACSNGDVGVVNLLLRNGASTQITEEDGWSPLHMASRYGHTEVIRALLTADKANIDATERLESWTALHVAIYNGQSDAVSVLLKQGANVSIQDNDGWTPLMTAIKRKDEDIVSKLLNQEGAIGLETRDFSGHTPLLAASINGFSAGASLLIKAGADCNTTSSRSKSTALIAATCWGHTEIVEALLGSGRTDLNIQDEDRWAALHFASNKGDSKVVELLLQHDANVHLDTDDGQTALHLASKMGNENIARQHLEAKAKVDAKDQDGKTALHLASGAGPEDCSEQESDELGPDDPILEEREKDKFGSGRHAAVVKLLLEWKARPDARTNKNETALHLAAARGDPTRMDPILAFMEQKHMSTRNDQGRTAFYLACTGENPESAVKSLLKSDKLRAAEFGRADGEDDEIKWAANYPETHGVAKWLMEERWERKKTPKPEGSDDWGVIEWAAYSWLPEVLSLLITKSPESSEIQALLKSMLESVLEPKPEANKQPAHEIRDDTEQAKSYEVLSVLIASSPRTPSLNEELKPALKKTLHLALGKGVKQGVGHRRLLQVLSQLVATLSGTSEVDVALESTLKLVEKPEEGTTYEQLSQVLWLLISNSRRTPDIDTALKSAQKSISKLVGSTEKRPQDPESASAQPKVPKAEAGVSSHKGKTRDPGAAKFERGVSEMTVPTASTTRTGKDKIDYLHAIIDILRDPPFSQTHKDSKIDGPPKHNDKLSGVLGDHEAIIVQFYKGEGESGTLRRYRSLKEVIYDHGPGEIMEKTISDLKKILGGRSEIAGSIVYLNTEPKFTWVHLPATNMVWMNDILLRIMNDEKCEGGSYHELKSFFRDSWVQVPDRTSSSRSMRPRTVVRRQENEVSGNQGNLKKEEEERSDKIKREENKGEEGDQKSKKEGKKEEGKKEEGKDGEKEPPKAKIETEPEEDRRKKNKPDFGAASATYMPYFCFSTQYQDEAGLRGGQKKFTDMKTVYEGLNDAKNPVIHESPTLDEWYYHFASDEKSMRDRNSRNRTQVVTKAIAAGKSTKVAMGLDDCKQMAHNRHLLLVRR